MIWCMRYWLKNGVRRVNAFSSIKAKQPPCTIRSYEGLPSVLILGMVDIQGSQIKMKNIKQNGKRECYNYSRHCTLI